MPLPSRHRVLSSTIRRAPILWRHTCRGLQRAQNMPSISPQFSPSLNHITPMLTCRRLSPYVQPNKVELLPGGLAAVESNVGRFHSGGVSGVKLVVRPFETSA